MKAKILVVSHGTLAQSLVDTCEMIIGTQEGIESIGLKAGVDPQSFKEQIFEMIEANKESEMLVLVDILGGTPFNSLISSMQCSHVQFVTGVNLGMLLEVLLNQDDLDLKELSDLAKAKGIEAIMNKNDLMNNMKVED